LLFDMFGGKVPLRPRETLPGSRPFLVARVGLNRTVLLEAAVGAAGCVKRGSGDVIPNQNLSSRAVEKEKPRHWAGALESGSGGRICATRGPVLKVPAVTRRTRSPDFRLRA
jgi:hypothetical protein